MNLPSGTSVTAQNINPKPIEFRNANTPMRLVNNNLKTIEHN